MKCLYRLKKDLPFANKGDSVTLTSKPTGNKHFFTECIVAGERANTHFIIFDDKIDEWFEEVKPREWNLLVNKKTSVASFEMRFPYDRNDYEQIRVREVIE